MSEAQQAPREIWTQYNHKYVEGTHKDGYAVCVHCGATESDDAILKVCQLGPVGRELAEVGAAFIALGKAGDAACHGGGLEILRDGLDSMPQWAKNAVGDCSGHNPVAEARKAALTEAAGIPVNVPSEDREPGVHEWLDGVKSCLSAYRRKLNQMAEEATT